MARISSVPSAVYVISDGSGLRKIGSSIDPDGRLRQLSLGRELILEHRTALTTYGRVAERLTHVRLDAKRAKGEWFSISREEAIIAVEQAVIDAQAGVLGPRYQRVRATKGSDLQIRAKRLGLTQKRLAAIMGVTENTVSHQLRGHWQSGTPKYVKVIIAGAELMDKEQREAWIADVLAYSGAK